MNNKLKTEEECINYIHSLKKFGKKAGLDNIRTLTRLTGNVQDRLKCIHVAGTNGKGSVSAFISSIFIEHGYKVGLYTSPYIEVFNERIQINNKNIPSEKLVYYTNKIKNIIEADENLNPIEFEVITAIGFLYFFDEKCDIVVLETGLGGRYDATNIINDPALSVICTIGLDHMSILGDTIEKIAFEKAGIIKQNGRLAVYGNMDKSALNVIKKAACEKNADIYLSNEKPKIIEQSAGGSRIKYKNCEYFIPLAGGFQINNAALAIDAAHILKNEFNLKDEFIVRGIKNTVHKCRFEIFNNVNEKTAIIDGAHNVQGVSAFLSSLKTYFLNQKITFVFGMLNDKGYGECVRIAGKYKNAKIIVTNVPSLRQTDGGAVYNEVKKYTADCEYIPDYKTAIIKAANGGNKVFAIFGSLYLAGAARTLIGNRELNAHCLNNITN